MEWIIYFLKVVGLVALSFVAIKFFQSLFRDDHCEVAIHSRIEEMEENLIDQLADIKGRLNQIETSLKTPSQK